MKESVVVNFATTVADGKAYRVDHCNLDVIISVGYYVKSKYGTQFGIWTPNILKEYMEECFVLNDERPKNLSVDGCFSCHL